MKNRTSVLNIIFTVLIGLLFVCSVISTIVFRIYYSNYISNFNFGVIFPVAYIPNLHINIIFGIDVFDLLILLAVFIVSIFTCIKKKTQIFTRYLLPISFGIAIYLCIYFCVLSLISFFDGMFWCPFDDDIDCVPPTEMENFQIVFGFLANQIFALIALIAFIFIIVAIIISIVHAHKHKKEKEQYINSNNYKKVFITSGSILIGCVLFALIKPLAFVYNNTFTILFSESGISNLAAFYFRLTIFSYFLYLIFIVVGVNLIIDTVYYHKHIKKQLTLTE